MKRKLSKLLGIGLTIALLTSLLIVAVPASALTVPEVSFPGPADATISTLNADYVIRFELGKQISGNTTGGVIKKEDKIVITLPQGTVVDNTTLLATISAGPGWVYNGVAPEPNWENATLGAGTWSAHNTNRQIIYTMDSTGADAAGHYIGESAEVRIQITDGIKNPATPGEYTLAVETLKMDDTSLESAVTSAAYTISTPGITPLPGIVLAKNSAGILMKQSNSINTGILFAGAGGIVEVGPGTYDETIIANVAGQTIKATGEPGTVIIQNVDLLAGGAGTVAITGGVDPITGNAVTLDGFTISPNAIAPGATMVTVTGNQSTITNCDITAGTTNAILVTGTPTTTNTISNCTFTATSTKNNQTCIDAATTPSQVNVTDCTFTVGAKGTAIVTAGGAGGAPPLGATSISGNTITGSSGKGIQVSGGFATIMSNTLNSLTNALDVTAGNSSVKMNTIDGCGSSLANMGDAITIGGAATTVKLYNNTIENSAAANYALNIAANAGAGVNDRIYIHFNNILNNAKNLKVGVGADVVITHNWWGSADGPAAGSITGLAPTAPNPVLGSANSNSDVTVGASSISTRTTVGVDVAVITNVGTPGNASILSVSKYEANPEITSPPIMGTGSVLGYYDLYGKGIGPGQTVQVKFYGAVTKYSKLYYAGGISGQWSEVTTTVPGVVPSGVNVAGGYVYCNLNANTNPSINDLGGTVFALVDDQIEPQPSITQAAGGSPVIGAYDISIMPMFTWAAVPNAVRYEIMLCEDPSFTIIEWAYNVDNPFFKVEDEALRYGTTYYWRVRGVLDAAGTAFTPWTTGIFTTEEEPEEVVVDQTPIEVSSATPEVSVEIPPTKITVEPAEQAIPNYMLWIIVAVGAILVIALIVLIVRTRRVV
jgi:hypothetical protein